MATCFHEPEFGKQGTGLSAPTQWPPRTPGWSMMAAADGGAALAELGRLVPRGRHNMVAHVQTVAFQGVDVRPIDVQVQTAAGLPTFTMVECD